ncbi:MAG: hypothetical protein AB1390_00885 [Nitrospirota bacterium]
MKSLLFTFCSLLFIVHFPLALSVHAQDDIIKFIEEKQREIKEKENALLKEEERMKALRKDIDERIEKYATLLDRLETVLKKLEHVRNERLGNVVKLYEVMPPEEAATSLSAIPEHTVVKIISRMNPKKAGAIMACMDAQKAASITEAMTKFEKNFPTE